MFHKHILGKSLQGGKYHQLVCVTYSLDWYRAVYFWCTEGIISADL
jgi:hypothetical protein